MLTPMVPVAYLRTVHQFLLQHHQIHTIRDRYRDQDNQSLLSNRPHSKSTLAMDHMMAIWTDRCAVQIQVSIFVEFSSYRKVRRHLLNPSWTSDLFPFHRLLPELWNSTSTTTATTKFPTKYVATTIERSIQVGSSNGYRRNEDVIAAARHVGWAINTVSQQQ